MEKIIKSRRIREEQDAAYLESLRIDQEGVLERTNSYVFMSAWKSCTQVYMR